MDWGHMYSYRGTIVDIGVLVLTLVNHNCNPNLTPTLTVRLALFLLFLH